MMRCSARPGRRRIEIALVTMVALWGPLVAASPDRATAQDGWHRHTIDDASRGADGIRVGDANGDGLPDLVTGWEEGGQIRVCLHPGPGRARERWPAVTVGRVRSPEDAVFVDLDADGRPDVVSCCEGSTRTMYVHWSPSETADLLDDRAWTTESFPATEGRQLWMYAVPEQVDGHGGVDLIVGSKGSEGSIGWLRSPDIPRDVDEWDLIELRDAGWIMSLESLDMDGDGDRDILFSDRKGSRRGVGWLEHPGFDGVREGRSWREHTLGGADHEVMFLDVADVCGDNRSEVIVATRNNAVLVFAQQDDSESWEATSYRNPFGMQNGKAVRAGDVNGDNVLDLVHSTNTGGNRSHPGVTWIEGEASSFLFDNPIDVSGTEGIKFDLIELMDVDRDGDPDVVCCEERDNLGVFWYENPLIR